MAKSLETLLGAVTLAGSGVLGGSTGYMIENCSANGYELGTAVGFAGYIAAIVLLFAGTYLTCKNSEKK